MCVPRGAMVSLFLLVLAACTAADHIESQVRQREGIRQLVIAKQWEFAAAERKSDLPLEIQSTQSARAALIADAKRDIESVEGAFADASVQDRISALYRAGTKAYKTGDDGGDLIIRIRSLGRAACNELEQAPERDCGGFEIFPQLALAEAEFNKMDQIALAAFRQSDTPGEQRFGWLGTDEVQDIVQSVMSLNRILETLTTLRQGKGDNAANAKAVSAVWRGHIDDQRVLIMCVAALANNWLQFVPAEEDSPSLGLAMSDAAASSQVIDAATESEAARKKAEASERLLPITRKVFPDEALATSVANEYPGILRRMTNATKTADTDIVWPVLDYCDAFQKEYADAQYKSLRILQNERPRP